MPLFGLLLSLTTCSFLPSLPPLRRPNSSRLRNTMKFLPDLAEQPLAAFLCLLCFLRLSRTVLAPVNVPGDATLAPSAADLLLLLWSRAVIAFPFLVLLCCTPAPTQAGSADVAPHSPTSLPAVPARPTDLHPSPCAVGGHILVSAQASGRHPLMLSFPLPAVPQVSTPRSRAPRPPPAPFRVGLAPFHPSSCTFALLLPAQQGKRLPPPRAVGDPSSSAFSRLPPARAVGDPSSSAFSHLPPPRAVGDPSSSAFSRLPPPRAVGDPSSSAFSRLPPARAVGDPSSSAFSRLSPPRAVGDPSLSAFSRLPPPRTVGDPSSSAFSRLPPPRAVGDPSSSAFSRLPPPRAVGDPSSSAFSRLPPPRAVGNPSSSALSRLPPVPRWPSARFHGLLIVGRLHGSDLTRRSSPLSSLRTSVGITGSARYAARRGERVGDLPRSLERLLRDGDRSRREYVRCTR
ncbi:unnamed protein product [Closterium sp. NIES-64]|nr:unnamed protein product [Closterium sp. NIES-64]